MNARDFRVLFLYEWKSGFSPTDFHFFKHLSNFLNEKTFRNRTNVDDTVLEFINTRTLDFYQKGIRKLVTRWQKFIESNGSYFD
ncbi:Histone-lysine N-methyltransferase SETMAR [Dufourea novaeangliae]|uniref:Histone-lysine N-methyltransferase SETMAR n=1 Tax=Dufourea novaeangliae TaxID=178035 RepID=A0A154P4A0_DUFNO|nr:Histone-lysine N-methyltransferase SETMAR [Dufourea novaeangliae]